MPTRDGAYDSKESNSYITPSDINTFSINQHTVYERLILFVGRPHKSPSGDFVANESAREPSGDQTAVSEREGDPK